MTTLEELLRQGKSFGQGASNGVASTLTGPVDTLAWLLRKGGLPVGDAPIGGEQWMRNQGLMATPENKLAGLLGEGLGMAAPIVGAAKAPEIAGGLIQMGKNLNATAKINKQAGKVFVYPQDAALAKAQINAAKPVSEGGLGLPANNTPMQRAKAMGFTDDAFHGTSADISAFNLGGSGKTHGSGAFFTENPHVASTYAGRDGGNVVPSVLRSESPVQVSTNGANWNWIGKNAKVDAPKISVADKEGDALMAQLFGDSTSTTVQKKSFKKTIGKLFPDDFKYDDHISTDDLARWANKEGYGSIVFDSVKDRGPSGVFANAESALPSKNTAVFNAANIRSRFAAFDPARRNEADLLGRADPKLLSLLAAGGLLGMAGYNKAKAEK